MDLFHNSYCYNSLRIYVPWYTPCLVGGRNQDHIPPQELAHGEVDQQDHQGGGGCRPSSRGGCPSAQHRRSPSSWHSASHSYRGRYAPQLRGPAGGPGSRLQLERICGCWARYCADSGASRAAAKTGAVARLGRDRRLPEELDPELLLEARRQQRDRVLEWHRQRESRRLRESGPVD